MKFTKNNETKGIYFRKDIDNLGEFRFVFCKTPEEELREGTNKYFVECFWSPENYGLVDFIVGLFVSDIDEAIEDYSNNMDYFIDGARVSCECRMASDEDKEGVYEGILMDYFNYTQCDICKIEKFEY